MQTDQARLLVLGSDADMHRSMCAALSGICTGAPLVHALDNGRAALDYLRSSATDIVTADLAALADLAADLETQVSRLVRAAGDALVIVVTADTSISTAMRALQAGAHDCLHMGMAPAAIADRLAGLARRHGKAPASDMAPAVSSPAEPAIPSMHDLVLPMWRQEQRIIEQAIESFSGNIALAAAALELSPSTIYRKRQAWAEMNARRAG